ncbi:hypothetical protein [uncultured Polaribacter sp.]|uniref:hypothetical protein n=1 Tax=uncultured Polaribacter sp. TaxID=174711 RepID=UPI00261C3F10|nr:hypothetical protein [uncultured Polaribacter sp.]
MWKSIFKTSIRNDYTCQVVNTIDEIDRTLWEQLTRDASIYLSYLYLKALEDGMSNEISFKYLVFFNKQKEAVCCAVLQIVSFKLAELIQDRVPEALAEKVRYVLSEDRALKLMICGNLFACGETGIAHHSSLSKPIALSLVSGAIAEMYSDKNKQNKISFAVFKEFWPASVSISDDLKKESFKDFYIDVNMIVDIAMEWKSFDDYLNAMNTKYRTRAKNVLKKSEDVKSRDFSAFDIQKYSEQIKILYKQVLQRVEYSLGELNTETFVYFKNNLKDDFVFTGYFVQDKMIGFSTAFVSKEFVDANFIGIDYDYLKGYKLYQRILYDYVALAIIKGTQSLRLGRTAETIKSGVGAQPIAMKLYTRHRNCISTELMGPVLNAIKPKEYELRTPFK